LLPYIYTTAWQAACSGLPMMRPLALIFPEDRRTHNIDDQFLLGDALLAAPVGRPGQTRRPVYLPTGLWYDYWTGEQHSGTISADAPLERMPIFVRAGSVVPMGPVIQHTGQWPPQALQLHIYPGDGESWLYEDDGHSMDYAAGESRRTHFVCESTAGGLIVHREAKGPFDPGYDRYEITIHGLSTAPRRVLVNNQSLATAYDADEKTASLTIGPWQRLEIV
jgi:alpha-glucosidase